MRREADYEQWEVRLGSRGGSDSLPQMMLHVGSSRGHAIQVSIVPVPGSCFAHDTHMATLAPGSLKRGLFLGTTLV